MVETKSDDDEGSLVHWWLIGMFQNLTQLNLSDNPGSASFGKYYKSHFAGQGIAA